MIDNTYAGWDPKTGGTVRAKPLKRQKDHLGQNFFIKSKFEFKHDLKFMVALKRSFVPKKVKNQLMFAVQEEQNINLIFMAIGQG